MPHCHDAQFPAHISVFIHYIVQIMSAAATPIHTYVYVCTDIQTYVRRIVANDVGVTPLLFTFNLCQIVVETFFTSILLLFMLFADNWVHFPSVCVCVCVRARVCVAV